LCIITKIEDNDGGVKTELNADIPSIYPELYNVAEGGGFTG
jgi:hypothetical protein